MIRKIKNYEITEEDNKIINIVKVEGTNRTTGHAYKYNSKFNAWIKLEDIKFSTLKNGIYKDTIQIF